MNSENREDQEVRWKEYHAKAHEAGPSSLIVEAMAYVSSKMHAIDVGAGSLRDSKYMLDHGFAQVIALDASSNMLTYAENIGDKSLDCVVSSFENFPFPTEEYDLVHAKSSLCFNPPETFPEVFQKVLQSLKKGGILSLTMFGDQDGFAPNPARTFLSRKEFDALLMGFELLRPIQEQNEMLEIDTFGLKRWHTFSAIVKKPL